MVRRSEKFVKEQNDIIDKIIGILELDVKNSCVLYHLDNDKNKQNKIFELIPDIKKYFSSSTCRGINNPENTKRPYASIIRTFTKIKYTMVSSDHKIVLDDGKIVRTKKYIFFKK